MKVYLSKQAESKLLNLTAYLLQKWGLKVKKDFVQKLTKRINQIALHPESCPLSAEFKGLYKGMISKQTTFYYRVDFDLKEIEIITIFDTRQNPDKLSQEI